MVSYWWNTHRRAETTLVLILIVMDNGLLHLKLLSVEVAESEVLILIVMDNGLLP